MGESEPGVGGALGAWALLGLDEEQQWRGAVPGPALSAVTARLSSVPRPFLDERISVEALSGDVFAGPRVLHSMAFADDPAVRTGIALGLWLFASEEVVEPFDPALASASTFGVDALALRLAPVVPPADWIAHDERREEAARLFLLWSGLLPAGEDAATARALLAARDTLSRHASLAQAFEEQQHRAAVARQLADARAKEAAARYSHE